MRNCGYLISLLLIMCNGCSISRIYPSIKGDTQLSQPDHTVFLSLAGYYPLSTLAPGPDSWASGFVFSIDEGVMESISGSYHYGYRSNETQHTLNLTHFAPTRAVLTPTDHTTHLGPNKIPAMKEGRYLLDVVYRVKGHEHVHRFKVVYDRRVDWGIEWIKLPN